MPRASAPPAAVLERPDPASLLGGRTPDAFLARLWQREPMLVRGAWPPAANLLGARELFALAARDDVESRLVIRDGARWSLDHGPFRRRDFDGLPPRGWTLLVQGVNLHHRAADHLLRAFDFLPFARLDDLMVSYATPGGGVGPHFDSYDVFLLQGVGRRRWRYGRQDDLALKPNLPLKILRRFAPAHDEVLAPGDMLYLPPQAAHDGIAVDTCTTYSIGFRAAGANELAQAFLDHLRDTLDLPGRYADPGIVPTRTPAHIDDAVHARHARLLEGVAWNEDAVRRFVGTWLSEPKPSVFFTPPEGALPFAAFRRRAAREGLALDLRTQMLYDDAHLYVNGAAVTWPEGERSLLQTLADARGLTAAQWARLEDAQARLVHAWYRDGYLGFD